MIFDVKEFEGIMSNAAMHTCLAYHERTVPLPFIHYCGHPNPTLIVDVASLHR